jgi:hypothetical protein
MAKSGLKAKQAKALPSILQSASFNPFFSVCFVLNKTQAQPHPCAL